MATDELDGGGGARILYVGGNEATRRDISTHAADEDPSLTVRTANSIDSALTAASEQSPDCVVAAYDLPDGNGIELFKRLQAEGYDDGPFLLFTDHSAAGIARDAFRAGIDDYVQKQPSPETYDFLFDKIAGALNDDRGAVDYATGGERRDIDTLVALSNDETAPEWVAGDISSLDSAPAAGDVYDALADILDNDNSFRAHLARSHDDQLTDPRVWKYGDSSGAVEHTRVTLPSDAWLDIFRDVSGDYEREARLRRFDRLLDTAQDGLYALDSNGHYTYVNESMAATVGYEPEEMLGMHAGSVLGAGEFKRGQTAVQELVSDTGRESEVLELSIETADGTELPVAIHFAPLYDDTGEYDGLVGVLRDISDRKERERQLRESERRYRALAENVPNGAVAMFDEELRYTLVAGEIFETLDLKIDAFEGAKLSDIHTAGYMRKFGPLYEGVFDGDRASFEFAHQNGHYRTNLVPLRDADGNIDAGLSMVVDVTEQREYERELERQNERLGEFASIVSHDLRNPLNVIEGRLQLYRETGEDEHLDAAERSVGKMSDLIEDLLDLARQGQAVGDIETVDLEAIVGNCRATLDTDEATFVADDLGRLRADPARLGQLLTNLFRNSLEHAGPTVTVRVGMLSDGFYVEDDGPGIPPDRRETVLEYGVSDSADGTGIGLAIVSEIAEAHGWTIQVTESEDGGARFEFTGTDRAERPSEFTNST